MKTKTKKRIWKITKITWFIIGGFILSWTLILLIAMLRSSDFMLIVAALLFITGIYTLGIFIVITLLFILTKWVIKKLKKK